jgi:hypothetical protein
MTRELKDVGHIGLFFQCTMLVVDHLQNQSKKDELFFKRDVLRYRITLLTTPDDPLTSSATEE